MEQLPILNAVIFNMLLFNEKNLYQCEQLILNIILADWYVFDVTKPRSWWSRDFWLVPSYPAVGVE